MTDKSNSAPARAQRIELLDSLRALALLGVIVMNIGAMVMAVAGREVMASAGPADIAAMGLDLTFFQGKARACFAFLFGVGFAILMVRAEAKGADFGRFYVRRMLALLAFGWINQAFLFWGDILVLYAVLGLLLLPLRRLSQRAVLRAGLFLVIVPPILVGLVEILIGQRFPSFAEANGAAESARALAALTSPDYLDAIRFNLPHSAERYLTDTGPMIGYASAVFGLFLLGAWTVRRGIVFDVEGHRPLLRRIAWICIPVGLALSLVSASRLAGFPAEGALRGVVSAAALGLPLLAFGYMAALSLLFSRRARRFQSLLAPAGRMALTNYLLSGAIGGWIFYGYGLGLLREFGMAGLNLLAFALFLLLAGFSHAWLARFRFGPAEWLWRSLSHGTVQPLALRKREVPAAA